ncbi:PLP-dependent transferase [Pseudomonas sp. H11T01]|uniref:PLP-dependent transferase n=1 Tax=Pseudomonas sp. H11T01 TaxID=3402749 RepID=UPI003AD63420
MRKQYRPFADQVAQDARLIAETSENKTAQNETTRLYQIEALPPGKNQIWPDLLQQLTVKFEKLIAETERHQRFAITEGLSLEQSSIDYVLERTSNSLTRLNRLTSQELPHTSACHAYRLMIQEYAFLRNSLAWCSASNNQSGCIMFFDPQENSSSAVNYDRYGSIQLREVEINLLQSLGFNNETNDLLLASSGQAAYTIIESFLLGSVFLKGTRVVTSPYIYFEAFEQLERLHHVELIRSCSWELDDLVALVQTTNASVIFLDPVANDRNLNILDFKVLASKIVPYDWKDKWLVIDGTMVSGGVDVFEIFGAENHPTVLYYESGSKYLQFGLDMQMAGIVVAPKKYSSQLATSRRSTGGVMYQSGVTKFPEYDRSMYLRRAQLLSKNARHFTKGLLDNNFLTTRLDVAYPWNWRELGWQHGGGVVTITMKAAKLNNRTRLEEFIHMLLQRCRENHIPMTQGTSYGFSTTRVSANTMADDMPAHLRFSIGEEDPYLMQCLVDIVVSTLCGFLSDFDS